MEVIMKWLEVIHLRASGNIREVLTPDIAELLNQIGGSAGFPEVKIFFHVSVTNDLAVHLFWDTETMDPRGSLIGHQLIQILKSFGLTNYNLWKEEERK